MEAFVWNEGFVTGLPVVDEQHRHLAAIINRLGELLFADDAAETDLTAMFLELAEYARRHFAEEERFMAEAGLDERHVGSHRRRHQEFMEQVALMWRARERTANAGKVLHGFLASWLAYHILGEDRAMARQIVRVRDGISPAAAFEVEMAPAGAGTAVLLQALHNLYGIITAQNRELARTNAGLEEKVAERTRQLTETKERLEREQSELTQLLGKVEEAQGQLLQSEKMAAIGQLAAGVAHEINNPVGFVNSNLGSLRGYVDKLLGVLDMYERVAIRLPAEEREYIAAALRDADLDFLRQDIVDLLHESEDGLARVRKIVQDLREFSHVNESEMQEADINAGIESTLNVVWNELKYKAQVVKEYGCLPPVRCVPAQINQVFMNLLVNAAQAIEESGTITIRSWAEGDWICVEISDTGKGMPTDVQRRIFEPFFTTKPVGKGTGLGLSISSDIVVKKHGGRIEVESEPGKGTTFRTWLPLLPAPAGGGGDGGNG